METCVAALRASAWPEVVWRFSALSTDGCPLQFDFSTATSGLRYATEVSGPEAPTRTRLREAARLVDRLSGTNALPLEILLCWEMLQSRAPLRWGAWLGIRYDSGNSSAKVYVEVPRSLQRTAEIGRIARPVVPSSELMMIGYHCRTHTPEYYFRQPRMNGHESATFAKFARDANGRQAVLDAFAGICGLPVRAALDWVNFGYSLAPSSAPGADFAMFVRAHSIRDDARLRAAFLNREKASGGGDSAYRDLVGSLTHESIPRHEMVTLISRGDSDVEMRVGVSAAALARL